MAEYTYDQIKQIVANNGGLPPAIASTINAQQATGPQTFTGTTTIDIGKYQDEVMALSFSEESDQTFDARVDVKAQDVTKLLGIDNSKKNIYIPGATGGSIFLNSSRVVINSKDDYTMMFGKEGVAIGSPKEVNIDSGTSITLFGHEQVFIGVPNRGEEITGDVDKARDPAASVGDPTPDELYEPLILGVKLINFLEDFIVTLENSEIAGPLGNGVFQPSSLAEFELLKTRLPELISEYGFIDGLTHGTIDAERLKTVKAAKEKAKDYVPPRTLTGTVSGAVGAGGPGAAGPPPNPVTNPMAEVAGFYETPASPLFGDAL
jgi:hypothetical protein|tara:strand:+ start:888 stop:1847 length:960 start_codon:yes stop_codon:yes gene_type:complete